MENCHSNTKKTRSDYLLWGSLLVVVAFYLVHFFFSNSLKTGGIKTFSISVFELMNVMWWGMALGIIFIGLLSKIPRELVISILGQGNGLSSVFRATMAGLLLDLCSHGILMVGMKLYERGASLGQVMAFLIASPWNSFSLTLVMIGLIGLNWTLSFILLSLVIAVISGMIFNKLVVSGKLPANPNKIDLPKDFSFKKEAGKLFKKSKFSLTGFSGVLKEGLSGARIVIKWMLFGVVLAALIRTFVSVEHFSTYFGATIIGLSLTVVVATILEICSEGSAPIAADILNRADAPGNSFAFLMTGVSTDYTEIMSIKDTTLSWKIALFLPLITLPQVIFIAWMINFSFSN